MVHGSGRAGGGLMARHDGRPVSVLVPDGSLGDAVAGHVAATDTELLRLLLESLRRWQPAEPGDPP